MPLTAAITQLLKNSNRAVMACPRPDKVADRVGVLPRRPREKKLVPSAPASGPAAPVGMTARTSNTTSILSSSAISRSISSSIQRVELSGRLSVGAIPSFVVSSGVGRGGGLRFGQGRSAVRRMLYIHWSECPRARHAEPKPIRVALSPTARRLFYGGGIKSVSVDAVAAAT